MAGSAVEVAKDTRRLPIDTRTILLNVLPFLPAEDRARLALASAAACRVVDRVCELQLEDGAPHASTALGCKHDILFVGAPAGDGEAVRAQKPQKQLMAAAAAGGGGEADAAAGRLGSSLSEFLRLSLWDPWRINTQALRLVSAEVVFEGVDQFGQPVGRGLRRGGDGNGVEMAPTCLACPGGAVTTWTVRIENDSGASTWLGVSWAPFAVHTGFMYSTADGAECTTRAWRSYNGETHTGIKAAEPGRSTKPFHQAKLCTLVADRRDPQAQTVRLYVDGEEQIEASAFRNDELPPVEVPFYPAIGYYAGMAKHTMLGRAWRTWRPVMLEATGGKFAVDEELAAQDAWRSRRR